MGAFKLTFIGGEATLYGSTTNNQPLFDLIEFAKDLGYEYMRLDTNGQFNLDLMNSSAFMKLDEISYSIDGFDANTNDLIRGKGTFNKAILRIRRSLMLGMNVHITTCVIKQNTEKTGSITEFIERMILLGETEGISTINFHGVFRMGVPMDAWTEGSHIQPNEWVFAYKEIYNRIIQGKYRVQVRLPVHVIERNEFNKDPEYYGYCPCKLGERVLIHPDGIIRICSSMLSTCYGVAKYDNEKILWENITTELFRHDKNKNTPCTNQTALYTKDIVPVCFSFKPRQTEPVWLHLVKENLIKQKALIMEQST
jgi:MoaA/NifB/PqqE/SkfB family radical SAM enzyme